jgi:hypothetical protein
LEIEAVVSLLQRGLWEQALGKAVLHLDHHEPARPTLRLCRIASVPGQQQALPGTRRTADPETRDLDAARQDSAALDHSR